MNVTWPPSTDMEWICASQGSKGIASAILRSFSLQVLIIVR